ncbi:calreticulin-3 [Terrapene carolina triunguis]|uniref:calreticulin-3 n=1 Tax=Terrapene triunguis TaxID=2587831 RepID=UPI001156AC36|nr:calreticulin-3 [Terrapene carolina triunguis]
MRRENTNQTAPELTRRQISWRRRLVRLQLFPGCADEYCFPARGSGTGLEMGPLALALLFWAALSAARAVVYFREQFMDGVKWQDRWMNSQYKSDYGKFRLTAGKFYGDAVRDKGLQTSENSKFYAISSRFKPFSNKGKSLVIQYTVKHEQKIDCGGGYIKIFSSNLDQKNMSGDSQYYIMFGPDICGSETKKVHVILNYKSKPHPMKKRIRCKVDGFTHLYTLILRPDQTYEVKIDNEIIESGNLEDDWNFLPPRKINDPTAKKPKDWDDVPQIDDPNDVKPEDWDEPEYILDTSAEKPEDWDNATNGEWQPPMIKNPLYRGEWKPRKIDNPNYKGVWPCPQIENPNYSPDFNIYSYENISIIGLDLWQVRAGTIFDNFLITDDEQYAEDFGDDTWGETKDPEEKMNIKQTEEEKKRERAKEEKRFRERFNRKVEKQKESGKTKLNRITVKKEEL